jgi:hypothetical protein
MLDSLSPPAGARLRTSASIAAGLRVAIAEGHLDLPSPGQGATHAALAQWPHLRTIVEHIDEEFVLTVLRRQ